MSAERPAAREPLPEACTCESCQDAAWPQTKGHDAAWRRCVASMTKDDLDVSKPASVALVATRDHLVAERDTLAEAMRLLDLAIGGHTRGCDAPDDPDCPRCVWDSEWSRYREVRDAD